MIQRVPLSRAISVSSELWSAVRFTRIEVRDLKSCEQELEKWIGRSRMPSQIEARNRAAERIRFQYSKRKGFLDLSNLGLTSIKGIPLTKNLASLDVSGNKLTYLRNIDLSGIWKVSLARNEIRFLQNVNFSNVAHLDLSKNRISSVKDVRLWNVKVLDITENPIEPKDVLQDPRFLGEVRHTPFQPKEVDGFRQKMRPQRNHSKLFVFSGT